MATPITLKVFRGSELVRTEQFSREIIKIGRLATAHLSLEDDRISRIHAVVEVSPEGAVSIIDMGSAEGTFVNGKKVSRAPLKVGDTVAIGGLQITLELPGVAAPAPIVAAVAAAAPVAAAPTTPAPTAPRSAAASPRPAVAPAAARPAVPGRAAAPAAVPAPAPAAPVPAAPVPSSAPAGATAVAPRHHGKGRWDLRREAGKAEDLTQGTVEVELRLLWRETLIDAAAFGAPKHPVLVGEGAGCALAVPAALLPSPQFPALRFRDGEYAFAFSGAKGGVLEERGARTPLAELVARAKAQPDDKAQGVYWIGVPRAGAVRAELGDGLALEARPRRPDETVVPPFWERINYQLVNLLLVLLFMGAGFIVAADNYSDDTGTRSDELFKTDQRLAKYVLKPPEAPKPVEKLPGEKANKSEQSGELAEKHKGTEGQMGKKDAPKTTGRSAPKAVDPNAKDEARNLGALAVLGRGGAAGGLATVFGKDGLGGDIKGAVGNMYGTAVGDSQGFGGLGVRGTGTGGGGSGETVGIGGIGTKGRGGGLGGYGQGVGGLGRKTEREIAISNGPATILGSIDKELIRAVIREHASQIRFCYEEQLAVNPKLKGKVLIRWTIDADGNASSAAVGEGTDLKDDKVHQCMMARIVSWQFPKPKGGGVAVITFPWILRAAGSE